jgi:hypothetical protein
LSFGDNTTGWEELTTDFTDSTDENAISADGARHFEQEIAEDAEKERGTMQ